MSESESLAHDWFPRALPDNVVIGERSWLYSSFAFLHYRSDQPCGVRIGSDRWAKLRLAITARS